MVSLHLSFCTWCLFHWHAVVCSLFALFQRFCHLGCCTLCARLKLKCFCDPTHTLSHSVSEHIQYFSPYVSFGCCISRMWASLFEWFRSQCWSATALKRFLKTTIILKHSSFRKVNETLSLHVKIAARLMGCEMGYCCWPRPEKQQVAPLSLN